jgi:hypothetical protein
LKTFFTALLLLALWHPCAAAQSTAAIEATYIGDQLKADVGRMVNNYRDNASGYKQALVAGRGVAEVASVMAQDADAFLARLNRMRDLATRNSAKFAAAVQANGWTVTDVNALGQTLRNVANHTKAASLTTAAEINAEADFILSNVPNFERVF